MKPGSHDTPVAISPALLAQVEAAASEEHRAPSDMVEEALERYIEDREWQKLYAYGEERAKTLGLTEADVPRLVAEYRQEKRQGRE